MGLNQNDASEFQEQLPETAIRPTHLMAGQVAAFERDIARLQARMDECVEVDCPACQSSQKQPIFQKYGFSFVACEDCATWYMTPRPSPQLMNDYYSNSENYQYWAKYIFPASEDARREKIHRPWLERVKAYCQTFENDCETLIEVGPGFGTFSALATESGFFKQVLAIEPTPELAQACRDRGVNVINRRVEDVGNEIPPASVVVSFEVIEHLFWPQDFLRMCAKLLKPGGLLVLSCPNSQGFDIQTLREKSGAVDVEHVTLFNPNSLQLLLKNCGLQIVASSTPGKLDAELVRTAALEQKINLSEQPFLKTVLLDRWDDLGWPFQQFLNQHHLSSHLWTVARKPV